jgi:hypothetical protein
MTKDERSALSRRNVLQRHDDRIANLIAQDRSAFRVIDPLAGTETWNIEPVDELADASLPGLAAQMIEADGGRDAHEPGGRVAVAQLIAPRQRAGDGLVTEIIGFARAPVMR